MGVAALIILVSGLLSASFPVTKALGAAQPRSTIEPAPNGPRESLVRQETEPSQDVVQALLDAVRRAIDASITGWEFHPDPPPTDEEADGTGARPSSRAAEEQGQEQRPWEPVSLSHSTRERHFSYRATVTIPDVFAGQRTAEIPPGEVHQGAASVSEAEGVPARLRLRMSGPVDHAVRVFVDGERRADLPIVDSKTRAMSVPAVVLSETAVPGQSFEVLLEVHNPAVYPPHEFLDVTRAFSFRGAELVLEGAEGMQGELERFTVNIEAAKRLVSPPELSAEERARRWPEFVDRSRVDPQERRSLARLLVEGVAAFDSVALVSGDTGRLRASMEEVLLRLTPVGDFAKTFTIYAVGNAHIDLAWLWRKAESVEIALGTYRSVLNNMGEFPELTYAQSQSQSYRWVEERDAQLFADIQGRIEAGAWDPVGGMWVESDCNTPGGESWVRQLLYGQRYFRDRFGTQPTLGWNPDSFGYNWNMPQMFARAGIGAFVTQKLSWNDTTVFPYHLFWWEAPDGSRVLAYLPTGSYTERLEPGRMVDQIVRFEQNTGLRETLILFGLGNHGGGPNREMLTRARMLGEQPLFPRVEFITAHGFIQRLRSYDLSNLPVWKDELYMEGHRGTLTTHAEAKRGNRKSEALLETSEKAATIASLLGHPYPDAELREAWQRVLFNQFHDILPGSSITPVYADAAEDYKRAGKLARRALDSALDAIAAEASLPRDGWRALIVFNPLSWPRPDVVRVSLPPDAPRRIAVRGPDGVLVPSQVVMSADELDRELMFVAEGVPALGFGLYALMDAEGAGQSLEALPGEPLGPAAVRGAEPGRTQAGDAENPNFVIENEFLRVEVDPATGNIASIVDKRGGWEVLAEGRQGNRLELHENLPEYWDAWNIGYTGRSWTLDEADAVELVERGPVRSVIRVRKSFLGLSKANREPTIGFPSSFFEQDVIVYLGIPRVDVQLRTDWWEDHTLLKVAFPFAVRSGMARYEIPFASVERPTVREEPWQKARFEVPVHRWADVSAPVPSTRRRGRAQVRGVSLLNDGKYGMDTLGEVMRLTIHTSPLWPDPFADRGKHATVYSVYPHAGDWREAGTVRRGQELNLPLVARYVEPHSAESVEAEPGGRSTRTTALLPARESFVTVNARTVDLTSMKRSEDGEGIILRLVETAGDGGTVEVIVRAPVALVEEVDLLEDVIGATAHGPDRFSFTIRPNEVRSFKVTLAASR